MALGLNVSTAVLEVKGGSLFLPVFLRESETTSKDPSNSGILAGSLAGFLVICLENHPLQTPREALDLVLQVPGPVSECSLFLSTPSVPGSMLVSCPRCTSTHSPLTPSPTCYPTLSPSSLCPCDLTAFSLECPAGRGHSSRCAGLLCMFQCLPQFSCFLPFPHFSPLTPKA